MASGNSMNISTIPITLRNGRVRPVKREYWRLVLIGQEILRGDEIYFVPTKSFCPLTIDGGMMCNCLKRTVIRRRVKAGKS